MSTPLLLLQVEDSETDAAMIRRLLEQAGYEVEWECVDSTQRMRAALAADCAWDVIIAAYRLSQMDAASGLQILRESRRDIPFIVVSGTPGEEFAVTMLKRGAQDYLMKDKLLRLASAVKTEITEARVRQTRRQAEESVHPSSRRLSMALGAARMGVWEWDLTTDDLHWSPECLEVLNIAGFNGRIDSFENALHPDDLVRMVAAGRRAIEERTQISEEFRVIQRTGEVGWFSNLGEAVYGDDGRPLRLAGIVQDITERKKAEAALRESDQRWQFALEGSGDGVWDWDAGSDRVYYSRQWKAMLGYDENEIGDQPFEFEDRLHPDDRARVMLALEKHYSGESPSYLAEYRLRCKDGTYKWILGRGRATRRDRDGRAVQAIGTNADLTALKAAEAERENLRVQFHQSQKMESIGRLAGGVAHDFNNLLTVINGYSALLMGQTKPDDKMREPVEQIHRAGERATALVRQLLAFSRRDEPTREVVNVNLIVEDLGKSLIRLVGEHIKIETRLSAGLPAALLGRGQMEQVLMNLVLNARDAMPDGGTLSIETGVVNSPGVSCALCNAPPPPGNYASLVVRDTGTGMDSETLQHLFEPFFTTKPPGQGTGLGLSVVHGIVTQNDGHLTLFSQPGSGTEVGVLFPLSEPSMLKEALKSKPVLNGTGTLLLTEDNAEVRKYLVRVLEEYGYRVLAARGPEDALGLLTAERVDLLITDIVMPQASGVELASKARIMRPGLPVLFVSGYSGQDPRQDPTLRGESFIQKPFSPEDLAAKVREVLKGGQVLARILVVDDEPGIRSFFRSVLEQAGYEIREAANGRQALRSLEDWRPDVVITDLVMPEKEGLETIQTMRQTYPSVRLLAISGAAGGRYLPVASHLGAHGVLNKPVNPDDLVATVGAILRSNGYQGRAPKS